MTRPKPSGWRASDITKPVDRALDEYENTIRDLSRTQLATISADDKAALRTRIADVRTQVSAFSAYAGVMESLETKIEELETTRPEPLPTLDLDSPPHAAVELRGLLSGTSFDTFDQFKAQRDAVAAAISNAAVWQKREAGVSEAQHDIESAQEPSAELDEVTGKLRAFYRRLWEHTDVEEAASDAFGETLAELRREIDLAATAVPKQPGGAATGSSAGRPEAESVRPAIRTATQGGGGVTGVVTLFGGGSGGGASEIVEAIFRWLVEADRRLTAWIWSRVDGFVDAHLGGWQTLGLLVFAFGVAIATGLSTEYAGKAFGSSLWDYIRLFLWGLATKLVFDTIVNGLDAVGVPRRLRR